jgi:serine/threonine protein kinase
LDDDFQVKIADFGLTRHSDATVTGSGAKHDNFAAPELFGYSDASESAAARTQETDVYAFGCLYYEVRNEKETLMPLTKDGLRRFITMLCLLKVKDTHKS